MRPVASHLTVEELADRVQRADRPTEQRRWRAILLSVQGVPSAAIADSCQRSKDWVRRTVTRYNDVGPTGMEDERRHNGKEKEGRPKY